jgi:hypothetical protein
MRSNGLTASAYSPVADLNPRVADALLDELKGMQVAAYCQPITGSTVAGFDRPEFVSEVLVRLYVDAAATDEVRELLAEKDPFLVQDNEDLTWAQIVAGYDAPATATVAPWPVYEDVDPTADDAADLEPAPAREPSTDEAWTGTRSWRPPENVPEERFVPPEPPPLPRLAPADKLSWVGLIGGPLVLVSAAAFSLTLPTWVTLFATLGFIGGFVSLVIRMDNGQDRLDDPDNGAQV